MVQGECWRGLKGSEFSKGFAKADPSSNGSRGVILHFASYFAHAPMMAAHDGSSLRANASEHPDGNR